MTETGRDAIFISHANPEDNAFTVWLGARLTAAGYEVWADVLRLRGGQDRMMSACCLAPCCLAPCCLVRDRASSA